MIDSGVDSANKVLIPAELITQQIFLIRGLKVMMDSSLAELYGVTTVRLNEQVKRNIHRFPKEFMFQLTKAEYESLRSQFAISNAGRGGRRYMPFVFTEHGVAMLASVLRSDRAVEMSIYIVKTFIRLREILASNKELAQKIEELERDQKVQNTHINRIYKILSQFIENPASNKNPIGFNKN